MAGFHAPVAAKTCWPAILIRRARIKLSGILQHEVERHRCERDGPVRFGARSVSCNNAQHWAWGPGTFNGTVAIDVGGNLEADRKICNSAEIAGVFSAAYIMPGEDGRQIVLCRGLRPSVDALWRAVEHFD